MGDDERDLGEFVKAAISPSKLRSFCLCQARVLALNQVRDPQLAREPSAIWGCVGHEIEAERMISLLGELDRVEIWTVGQAMDYLKVTVREALRRRVVLANGLRVHTFCTLVPELLPGRGCYGYPDALDCTDGMNPVVVELKHASAPRDGGSWWADRIQVAAYLAGVAVLGFQRPKARIVYARPGRYGQEASLRYGPGLEHALRRIAAGLDRVERGEVEPASPSPNVCRFCNLRWSCNWRQSL